MGLINAYALLGPSAAAYCRTSVCWAGLDVRLFLATKNRPNSSRSIKSFDVKFDLKQNMTMEKTKSIESTNTYCPSKSEAEMR